MSAKKSGDGTTKGVPHLEGTFRERLYQLRRAKGWSQSDVARRIWGEQTSKDGYKSAKNRDRISAYEGARAVPERENLEALAEVLGVGVADLAPDLVLSGRSVGGKPPGAPNISLVLVPGGNDVAHLTVDLFLPFGLGVEIIQLLQSASATPDGGAVPGVG